MAQFDVFVNPSRASRESIPCVVEVQSNLLRDLGTRLILPLAKPEFVPTKGPNALCPEVVVNGVTLRVLPYLAGAVRLRDLGHPVASLAHDGSLLVRALDAVIAGV